MRHRHRSAHPRQNSPVMNSEPEPESGSSESGPSTNSHIPQNTNSELLVIVPVRNKSSERNRDNDDTFDKILTCYSCGKLASNSSEPPCDKCAITSSAWVRASPVTPTLIPRHGIDPDHDHKKDENLIRTESEQTLLELAIRTQRPAKAKVKNVTLGLGLGGSDLESKITRAGTGSPSAPAPGPSSRSPNEPSTYFGIFDAASTSTPPDGQHEADEVKLTKSAIMEDVANLDDVSQIPEKQSQDSRTEIFDPSTIPKQPESTRRRRRRRKSGRKKWCCCCCQKRKNQNRAMNHNGGDQAAGINNNHDDESVESNGGLFQCLGSSTGDRPEIEEREETSPKPHRSGAQRRHRIPDRPNYSLSLWSILKNAVGKELTKVAMPVNFSEPLSMLQRLTEDYEYSSILDTARKCTNSCEQMCYVAAFTISSYATTAIRTGKPFNPLLGETFECDRKEDLGWKCISEQVSHHPPTAALYCEGNGWKCWQEFTMSSKFRGNYLEIIPLGIAHLKFDDGNHYTWRKVSTIVHNLVVGKLWVEQAGEMVLTNHTTGETCHLKYIPYSMFNKKQKEVVGTVVDKSGYIQWHINGTWDGKVDAWKRKTPKKLDAKQSQKTMSDEVTNGIPLWTRRYPPPESERYYHFTEFACQLNEMEEGVAPTDSRLRPDQRLMEQGDFDAANLEKVRLEEKQREARKKYGGDEAYYRPVWFKKEKDSVEGTPIHTYKGEYWNCKNAADWKKCPNIF